MTRDTCRDLVACFTWNQLRLGFFSVTSRLTETRRWVVHMAASQRLRRVQAEDGRVDATGCIEPFYLRIAIFYVLGPRAQ
jgi:hypothetical protein